ncbi:MAG: tRNA sulfurtransferase [Nanohaloarchaea archaeon]|nr:tRNA sulfurtransferase [Candidatus Nanohaloarchaea archaeon]
MNCVLVRFGEMGAKSNQVRGKMAKILRQRVQDILDYEDIDAKARTIEGRILVETKSSDEAAKLISKVPGVSSASPAKKVENNLEKIKQQIDEIEVGETFGVRANVAGDRKYNSRDLEVELGAHVEGKTGAQVDLDNPDTWLRIDLRQEGAFVFGQKIEGPDGFPVGSEGKLGALISGGIDSPVAAYEAMTRGSSITPIYFFNRPIAAEDHKMRFNAVVNKLKRFHPSKDWEAIIVDMKEVNEKLMDVDRGRMVLHRKIMLEVAERIAEQENLEGLVTGEAIGQKSSQTPRNLRITAPDIPVHRPLLTRSKSEITSKARELGTFEEAKINSACQTMAPDNPRTRMKESEMDSLRRKVGYEALVEKAVESAEKEIV